MAKIFISYNSNDEDVATANFIADVLSGEHDVYFTGNIRSKRYDLDSNIVLKSIKNALDQCQFFIVVCSKEYFSGEWSSLELNAIIEARAQNKSDFPIIIPFSRSKDGVPPLIAAYNPTYIETLSPKIINGRVKYEEENLSNVKPSKKEVLNNFVQKEQEFLILEQFDLFNVLIDKHEARLSYQIQEDKKRHTEIKDKKKIIREPNFVLCNNLNKNEYSLFIIDKGSTIDFDRVRSHDLKFRKIRGIADIDLFEAGFTNSEVHPCFKVKKGSVSNIIMDANILFQSLMFPLSLVMLPTGSKKGEKSIFHISSFFRSLTDFWGDISYINCSSRNWKNDLFFDLFKKAPVNSRFAPTPSNSLHIGNIKAAIIPYLFSKMNSEGSFLLRFDDTDAQRVREEHYHAILEDLNWFDIKISKNQVRRQSKQTKLYSEVLGTMRSAGFVIDGAENSCVHEPEKDQYYFWLDMVKGPVIRRGFQPKDAEGEPLNLDIQRANGTILYKLAGSIDDTIFSSHVFRDEDQLAQGLTDRQAYLSAIVRSSFEQKNDTELLLHEKLSKEAAQHINIKRRPFPLFSPIAYCHFGKVMDAEGKKLSKRNHSLSISEIRSHYRFIPEAIIACIVIPFFPNKKEWGKMKTNALNYLCDLGLEAFYEYVSSCLSFDIMDYLTKQKKAEEHAINKWERYIISNASAFLLNRLFRRIPQEFTAGQSLEKLIDNIRISDRSQFSCWRDIMILIPIFLKDSNLISRIVDQVLNKNLEREKLILLLSSENIKNFLEKLQLFSSEEKQILRKCFFEENNGIRLGVIPEIVGIDCINDIARRL